MNDVNITIDKEGKIFLGDTEIGSQQFQDGVSTVSLNVTYSTASNEWAVPISWFAAELQRLPEYSRPKPEVLLIIEATELDVDLVEHAFQRLDEKTIKGNGFTWRFHKNDIDPFPSELHAHDYEQGLKLDAIDGKFYDASTKSHRGTLKKRILEDIQSQLRASPDFCDKVKRLIKPVTLSNDT
ncbi:hypothetical protein [Brucella pseudogrignonensis]|uniref:hypothetical protein n=1 Tax=Brucella pseudogrignonensis TaxID=419475 RepID=UPI003ECC2DA2